MRAALQAAEGQRGAPLFALILLVCGWVGLRMLVWHVPFVAPVRGGAEQASESGRKGHNLMLRRQSRSNLPGLAVARLTTAGDFGLSSSAPGERVQARQAFAHRRPPGATLARTEPTSEILAGFAQDRPASAAQSEPADAPVPALWPGPARAASSRWTGDAWLLLRRGSGGPIAPGEPSYGRSQAGAVLRYRLALASGHRPLAYLRATRALAGVREGVAGVGLSARPIVGLPLRLAGEARLSEGTARREVRLAAYAVTELPPANLPLGLRAEAYAQAGYVGGRYATAFVDGQARLDAPVAGLGRGAELRAGGGLWGGAQKGAGRLDVGPSATMKVLVGKMGSRVAVDYRVRVAGGAAPRSGPTLTISAGF
jgi:hypothetical protein